MTSRTAETSEPPSERSRRRPSATAAGLVSALLVPPLYALVARPILFPDASAPLATAVGLAVLWVLVLALLALVRIGEGRPWRSIGLRPLPLRWLAAAVGIGIGLSLLVPLLGALAATLLPADDAATVGSVVERSWPVLLVAVITAAMTEEVLFRGYAMERLLELTGSTWLAVLVPLAAFTLTHAGGWSTAHVVGVVLPLGLALGLLYLVRRNLLLNVVVHFLIDVPLVVLAAAAG